MDWDRRTVARACLLATTALLGANAACDSPRAAPPDGPVSCAAKYRFQYSVNRKLDLVFVIDDSPAMQSQQARLAAQLPDLMHVLEQLPGGLPDLHIGVVSSSLGAGRFADVPGCMPETAGNNAGKFMRGAACTALAPGHTFIIADQGVKNFSGDIADAFACLVNLGAGGCRFPQPFAATRRALEKAADPRDPDNGGFLRDDAYLAIVLLTNQDDCSVPSDGDLFDPAQTTLADRYGGLQPYRCSELGMLCDGRPLPHDLPAGVDTLALANCASAEDGVHLSRVSDFVDFLHALKPGRPDQILVSALAGPTTPYAIGKRAFEGTSGVTEQQPTLQPSCFTAGGDTAVPSIRVKALLDAFGANAVLESVCSDDFKPVLTRLLQSVSRSYGVSCIPGSVAVKSNGQPDCQVSVRIGDSNTFIERAIPFCDAHQANFPCWKLSRQVARCGSLSEFFFCNDPTCSSFARDTDGIATSATVTCALSPPC